MPFTNTQYYSSTNLDVTEGGINCVDSYALPPAVFAASRALGTPCKTIALLLLICPVSIFGEPRSYYHCTVRKCTVASGDSGIN
ncbi:hypothetical protein PM082_014075 [Marasmius tenuissimus]|nr:hypothetical protein PM082_014075 [Marasmius tenuissimus]